MKLEDAIRALREEGEAPVPGPDETRARIIRSLEIARRRRTKRVLWLTPLAAVLAGATASAAVSGRIPAAWHSISAVLGLHHERPANEPSSSQRATPAPKAAEQRAVEAPAPVIALSEAPRVVAPPASPGPELAPPAPPAPERAPSSLSAPSSAPAPAPAPARVRARAADRRAAVRAAPSEPAPSVDNAASTPAAPETPVEEPQAAPANDSLDLYRTAHRLHFSARDPGRALAAWDAYLKADPNGSLALEARYNRALCLVRLGRKEEARTALAPFASGGTRGYRQSEAKALLESMKSGAAPRD